MKDPNPRWHLFYEYILRERIPCYARTMTRMPVDTVDPIGVIVRSMQTQPSRIVPVPSLLILYTIRRLERPLASAPILSYQDTSRLLGYPGLHYISIDGLCLPQDNNCMLAGSTYKSVGITAETQTLS